MARRIALLRGINVGGNKKVPMAELRELATGLGWHNVSTYIASGNVLYDSSATAGEDESALEAAIAGHFTFTVDVIVRDASRLRQLAAGSAFPDAEREREKFLHVGMSKSPPLAAAAESLANYTVNGESLALIEDGLWIDYVDGVGKSKLTPTVLDRCVGSTVTCRNWRTVKKLAELL